MRSFRWITAIATGLLLGACSSPPQHTGKQPLIEPDAAKELGYRIAWVSSTDVPPEHQLTRVARVGDVIVTVESPSPLLTGIQLRDGSIRWRKFLGGDADRLFQPVSGEVEKEFVVNSEHEAFVLNKRTGGLVRRMSLPWAVRTGPVIVGDSIVLGARNGRVFALHRRAGYTIWSYRMKRGVRVRPVLSNDRVLVADESGIFTMLDGADGEVYWKKRAYDAITARPDVANTAAVVPSEDHVLYAVDPGSGRDKWQHRSTASLGRRARVFGSAIYLPVKDRGLVAMDVVSGDEKWTADTGGRPVMPVGENRLLVHDEGQLLLLERSSGKVAQRIAVQPLKFVKPLGKNRLLLVSPLGRMVRLDPRSGA